MVRNIIFRNIPVSISGSVLSYGIMTIERESPPIFYSIFVFFSILFVYSFQRWYKSMSPFFAGSSRLIRPFYTFIFFLLSIIVLFLWGLDYRTVVILLFCLFLSAWYVYPFLNIKLREVPFLKAPLVAAIWTIVIVFLPLSIWKSEETVQLTCLFFVFFLALAIPFDIKDMDTDPKRHFTFPQLLGKSGAKLLSISLMVLFYILFIVQHPASISPVFYWSSLLVFSVFTVKLEKDSSYLNYIFIDSTMLILALGML